jgi:hypothetical protein
MPRPHALFTLIVLASQAGAQVQRPQLSSAQARNFEETLRSNPTDREARKALLDYYYLNPALDPAQAIPARRRHILWLIQNTPADELAGVSAATIDAAGHRLADPQGFKLASAAWKAQTERKDAEAATMVNAAFFFKLADKGFTIRLLERALALEPGNKQTGGRLGDEYALAIMGITMVNKNGYPLRADPGQTGSESAQLARDALKTSRNPHALAKAGYDLSFQGSILYYTGQLPFNTADLAEQTLQRAVSLAPDDPGVAAYLEQHREIQRQLPPDLAARGENSAALPVSRSAAFRRSSQIPEPAASAAASSTPVQAVAAQPTAGDLKKVTVGMNREQLLQMGKPSGQITLDEDGHLVEIYQYFANGSQFATIRLTDGTVSSVLIP